MKLVIKSLKKSFEKKEVLKDINFEFKKGKIYGLLGRNGAGKTTLFYCLNEDLEIDGGEFYIDEDGKKNIEAEDIGYVLSIPNVPEFLTAREFLKFFLEINQHRIKDLKSVDEYFDFVKIDVEDRDRLLKDYSHGMKNKMQMLVNIISNPKILLLDEPLTSFDVVVAEEMKEMFSNGEIQPKHENDIFEKAIDSEKLIFDGYSIVDVRYTPHQDVSENFTGDVTLSILWNKREPDENFYEFGWDFCYYKDGYNKTVFDTPNQLPDNSSVYYYDIDEYYRCSYTIINEVVNKEEILNQLLELCREIEAKLQG